MTVDAFVTVRNDSDWNFTGYPYGSELDFGTILTWTGSTPLVLLSLTNIPAGIYVVQANLSLIPPDGRPFWTQLDMPGVTYQGPRLAGGSLSSQLVTVSLCDVVTLTEEGGINLIACDYDNGAYDFYVNGAQLVAFSVNSVTNQDMERSLAYPKAGD